MVRPPLSPLERARGERLGLLLRTVRGERSQAEVAACAGIPAETLRKIEAGRVPMPAFFTVAAIARALEIPLETLAGIGSEPEPDPIPASFSTSA